jgi:aminoglycoside phosphotransferase (APT) family kinase protein
VTRAETELELLGEGREAETLAWGEHRVLRLLKDPTRIDRLERELVALTAARRGGAPVPAVYGRETINGRPGLVIERVVGPDLLTLLGRRPWLLPRVARRLGETHARVHAVQPDAGLPTVHAVVRSAITDSELVPDHFRRPALDLLELLPEGDRLCHWDFHPANLLDGHTGPIVIDWSFAARGHPAADVARTRLIVSAGARPPGPSSLIGRLDPLGRRLLSRLYMRAYRRSAPLDQALVDRWTPLVAVVRLTAGIPEERGRLIEMFESSIQLNGR